jgi:hypothetical protein
MATRAAQKAEVLTAAEALAFIERHGVVAESVRRGTVSCLADAIAGEQIRGNWWSHPKSRQIFAITRAVRDAPTILVCKLVDGKITFVHERLWPSLVRFADRLPHARVARVREVHSETGKHVLQETPFPDWVPKSALASARRVREVDAAALLQLLGLEQL